MGVVLVRDLGGDAGCKLVIHGEMEVGTYVATISVVSGIADSIQMVFEALLSMQVNQTSLSVDCLLTSP